MNYKYVLMEVAEKKKSRGILVNPSFQETRQLVASKTLRTFISVKIYGELIFNLSKPVDIVDLSRKNRFNSLIVSEGVLLYG